MAINFFKYIHSGHAASSTHMNRLFDAIFIILPLLGDFALLIPYLTSSSQHDKRVSNETFGDKACNSDA